MKRRPNRSLNWPWPAVPMNMPKMVALPIAASSAPVANFEPMIYGTSEPKIVKSMTSKK